MAVNATPYREGRGWALRLRYKGNDVYVSGCKSAAQARAEAHKEASHIDKHGQPAWGGPKGKTVAQALQRHAAETLRFKKGGAQEARRINCYLRLAGIDEIVLTELPDTEVRLEELPAQHQSPKKDVPRKSARVFFIQTWKPAQLERKIPNSLRPHRKLLAVKSADSNRLRAQIACSKFTEVTTDLLQRFVDALTDEGVQPGTVYQELAVLRQLFNTALRRWKWREPQVNPASGLHLPKVDNARERVMSVAEQERLHQALLRRRAKGVVELVGLAGETAMRADECIGLRWSEVHTDELLIKLDDAKNGKREVPLSPAAIELLHKLRAKATSDRVFEGMTYSKLSSAWRRACEEAGIRNLRFHDLRATAATRFALGPAGRNIFLVQALTGHKTLVMVERYVRIKASDAALLMHGLPSPHAPSAPAGQESAPVAAAVPSSVADAPAQPEAQHGNVVRIDFGMRRRA